MTTKLEIMREKIYTPAVINFTSMVNGLMISATASFDNHLNKYIASSITVQDPTTEVKSIRLHKIAVRRLLKENLRTEIYNHNPQTAYEMLHVMRRWVEKKHARKISEKKASDPGPDKLLEAACVAYCELIVGGFPVRTIERCCGVDYKTARRWWRMIKTEQGE